MKLRIIPTGATVGDMSRFGYRVLDCRDSGLGPAWLHEEVRLTLAPRSWTHSVFLLLALVIIFAHALAPSGSPLQRSSGSAFNPFTAEVSLVPKRSAALGRDSDDRRVTSKGSNQPDGGPADVALAFSPFALRPRSLGGAAPFPTPDSIAPGRLSSRGFLARAPPSA